MAVDFLSQTHAVLRSAAALLRNTSGNVAIITALLLPLLIGTAGFAMDYAYVAYVKQRIDRAAESAVVGAVSQSAATAMGGYQNLNGLTLYGKGLFNANVLQLAVGTITPNLTVVSNGGTGAIASVDYSTSINTLFSGLVGINSIPIKGSASAKANGLTYINYYIVLDISQSMGIAATATDMTNLFNRVVSYKNGMGGSPTQGCVFGCHVKGPGQTYTNEYLAHDISPRITLRVDSAVSAIQSIITSAKSAAGSNNNIKIGLYTMSKDPVSGQSLNTVSAPSSNYASLTNLAGTIELGNNTSAGKGDSDFSGQLSQFNLSLPANGSGVSALSPLNYVFLITDGLADTPGSCTSGHCTGAFSSTYCTNLKTKSTVGVIYTTYLPIYKNNDPTKGLDQDYTDLALPYVGQIKPNLQDCVSSNKYFFEASDGPAIATAMQALFDQSQQSAILTR